MVAARDNAFNDFDASRRERVRTTVEFKLGGERFRCVSALAAGPALDVATSPTVDTYRAWLRACMRDDDSVVKPDGTIIEDSSLARFEELLYRRDDPIEEQDLRAVSDWLAEVYAGRPTEPSTDSQGGRPTGGRSSRQVSLTAGKTPTT